MTKRCWFIDTKDTETQDIVSALTDIISLPGCYMNLKPIECWYVEISVIIEDLEYVALVERLIAPFV